MGLWKRIVNWFRGEANAAVTKLEDPEKQLSLIISDMRQQAIDAKTKSATAIAQEKRLKKQLALKSADVDEWESKAMKALQAGDEDLARRALTRKESLQSEATELNLQWQKADSAVTQLKEGLSALDNKISQAERQKSILVARQKRAEAQKQINATLGSLNVDDSYTEFGRLADKIEQLEAEADASSDLLAIGPGSEGAKLEEELKALEGGSNVDLALAAMKEQLALGPASDEAKSA
jgi:phage shock protein A